ncbi:MAG: Mut7-C RNAse domain-containing protein [Nitrospirae bacterium]|nr:Mut7-C RNAse domain-containing protein [Nitrospirota bacterium]
MMFIADAMLGRLAKWMKIMGCDVAYYRRIEDRELVHLALKDNRMILTRDTLLVRRKRAKGNFFLVEGNSYKDQLKQVAKQFSLNPYENLLTRCIECNIPLTEIDREKVKELIPEYVYGNQKNFLTCPGCGRIYWPATHKDGIMKTLEEIFRT